jgi:hypothetical protein
MEHSHQEKISTHMVRRRFLTGKLQIELDKAQREYQDYMRKMEQTASEQSKLQQRAQITQQELQHAQESKLCNL